jgi:hypothetical protein
MVKIYLTSHTYLKQTLNLINLFVVFIRIKDPSLRHPELRIQKFLMKSRTRNVQKILKNNIFVERLMLFVFHTIHIVIAVYETPNIVFDFKHQETHITYKKLGFVPSHLFE